MQTDSNQLVPNPVYKVEANQATGASGELLTMCVAWSCPHVT